MVPGTLKSELACSVYIHPPASSLRIAVFFFICSFFFFFLMVGLDPGPWGVLYPQPSFNF